jgi:hypothetical protein
MHHQNHDHDQGQPCLAYGSPHLFLLSLSHVLAGHTNMALAHEEYDFDVW